MKLVENTDLLRCYTVYTAYNKGVFEDTCISSLFWTHKLIRHKRRSTRPFLSVSNWMNTTVYWACREQHSFSLVAGVLSSSLDACQSIWSLFVTAFCSHCWLFCLSTPIASCCCIILFFYFCGMSPEFGTVDALMNKQRLITVDSTINIRNG